MGERLGRFIGNYRVNYFKPDKMNGPIVYSYKLLPGAEQRIYDAISDITISMKAADHLKMPELISSRYEVQMDGQEKQNYDQMKKQLVLSLPEGEVTAANAASLSGKLLQMANGAIYTDDGETQLIHDKKLDALEDMIEAANGKPVLVAYWFKHDLKRIMQRLTEKKIPFERLDTDASIGKWNKGEIPVALIHPVSAGHGLNLQSGGNTLIWFGLTWSLELYQQTVARLWRQGQTAGTVIVEHIITADTIDERVMKALELKDHTQSALIDAKEAEAAYQQINDLIRRFQLIDAAIVESNAKTEVNTSYGTFTVAGAISLRSRLRGMDAYDGEADFEGRLKNKLNNEYSERVQFCDMKNGQLQSTAESMRLSILGRDAKAKDDKPLGVVDAYMKENTTELVDPLDVKKKVDMLEEKRNILLTELDTQIKVSNATTFIEIA